MSTLLFVFFRWNPGTIGNCVPTNGVSCDLYANIISDLHGYNTIRQTGNGAVDTTLGYNFIAGLQVTQKFPMLLCLFLLWSDQQEIEHHKN